MRDGLDDSARVWYEPRFPQEYRPDIVAYIPGLGLLIYEVKDWSLDRIVQINPNQWQVRCGASVKDQRSPYQQAREYYHKLNPSLQRQTSLINSSGHNKGKVKIPIAPAVIFPNIKKSAFIESGYDKALDTDRCLFNDDLKAIAAEDEPKRTRDTLKKHFKAWWRHDALSAEELAILKDELHPEITSVQKDKGGKEKVIILDPYVL